MSYSQPTHLSAQLAYGGRPAPARPSMSKSERTPHSQLSSATLRPHAACLPACPSPPPLPFLAADIEAAFYNASAAKSPITQGAKFLKGIIPGAKK